VINYRNTNKTFVLFIFPSFSLLVMLYDPTDLIWRQGIPFEVWLVVQPSSTVSKLRYSGVFLSSKVTATISVHSHLISISTLSLTERRDTRDKWPLLRNPERSCWNRHTSVKIVLSTAHGFIESRNKNINLCTSGNEHWTKFCVSILEVTIS
jgi:hypothetical protein